jgi:hypothetical protein
MYVRDPLRVVVTGPLLSYVDGFCSQLGRWGYSPAGAAELVQLMAHLSRWLDGQRLVAADLTGEVVERFLADRRRRYRKRLTGRALGPLLIYLRGVGAVSEPTQRDDGSDVALLVDRYRRYLLRERGLAATPHGHDHRCLRDRPAFRNPLFTRLLRTPMPATAAPDRRTHRAGTARPRYGVLAQPAPPTRRRRRLATHERCEQLDLLLPRGDIGLSPSAWSATRPEC